MNKVIPGNFGRCIIVIVIFSITMMLAPLIVVTGASFNSVKMTFPPEGFTLSWYGQLVNNSEFLRAALVSLVVGLLASICSSILGLFAAMGLRYCTGKVKSIVNAMMLSPLFIPSIVVGLAIYQLSYLFFGGKPIWIIVFGHILLTIPFPLRTIAANLESLPLTLDEAAMSVGAKPLKVVRSILLPLIKPGFFAGWLLAFVMSWNDFNISIFLAKPKFYPLSIEIYQYLLYQYSPILAAMSVMLILFTIIVVLFMNKFFGLSGVTGIRTT